ncbi:ASPIC/UnbV domain protein [Gemmatirosa kalamazoonensis]|uniref:ASPIC/UnbV domain protein n=1 Tax=Gemmatirosa kalamazoonensis TaxID=861299 RepID=W0RPX9_9BACT|nr:CRTAC1 family protein [Gemmatirosa kalamazoonensis]AHG91568.1 ASPIC/UnbV domain protein [Gemmatirosa kalamazoonensis]
MHPPLRSRPAIRRAIIAVPFVAAIALAARLDREPFGGRVDPGHPGFAMRDVTAAAGIHFVHHRATLDPKLANVEPHIAAVGAGVAVTDVDGDGWPDLYFTNSRFGAPNALYRNRRDGTFEDVAARAGLADLNRPGEGVSMGSIWGDMDGDGREDVLVYRYGYLALFRNRGGGTFEDVTERAGLRRWVNSNGAIWLDYDRDGRLDLYVTAYFRSDVDLWHVASTRIMHDSFEFATNGGKNLLFHNVGGGRFEDVTDRMGVGSTRWTLAAASADFDGDGWPDLYLANDYGPEELYLNDHGKRFVPAKAGLESESKSGMSASLGDAYGRGRLDVFVTNISARGYLFQNNNLRLNEMDESRKFRNVADAQVADAGWAWGAQFGDFNNDGANELFVANGFISGDRGTSYWYSMSKIAGANGALFEDASRWPAFGNASLSGYERSRVYVNRGLAGWVDVAGAVGVTDTYDGRAVALADLWNRGATDVIVANQNQPAIVYRDEPDPASHWIGFRLVGTRSNRSAIGAEVVIEASGLTQRRVVDGGMGFASQNDRRLHFGLGRREWVDAITVSWPSGTRQVLHGLAVDQLHTITEPTR